MKNWITAIFIILVVALFVEVQQVKYANKKWKESEAKAKAYQSLTEKGNKKAIALKLTMAQLKDSKDSILVELMQTKKSLKIKDKQIGALQAIHSSFSRKDTVTLKDTIFRDSAFALDTIIQDEWYRLELGLHYPSMVTVKPEYKSKKHLIVTTKKETVNPPKKFFLLRWFQKHHTVLHIDVIEKNPYVKEQSSRYIEIIK